MTSLWVEPTSKFLRAINRMPVMTPAEIADLRGVELLATRPPRGRWQVGMSDDPGLVEQQVVLLSRGRHRGKPDLAFPAPQRLSEILYELEPDPPSAIRRHSLVAATWWFPEWDWYMNKPVYEENGDVGFPTTDGMYGTLRGHEFQAERVIIVCEQWSPLDPEDRGKIRRGGWPTPKDWSPRGRLPRRR